MIINKREKNKTEKEIEYEEMRKLEKSRNRRPNVFIWGISKMDANLNAVS